ncbi:hypothetical protein [Desulfosporosinus sp. I2]|nr:hypothetical protein [Desulfosporosinus sp. I2]
MSKNNHNQAENILPLTGEKQQTISMTGNQGMFFSFPCCSLRISYPAA